MPGPFHKLRPLLAPLCVLVLLALPAAIVCDHYTRADGFLRLIYFGEGWVTHALPEVRAIAPTPMSRDGYDGQFYAQLALRPSLRDPALQEALDVPWYRAHRIGLPFLARCLGLGRTGWVLQVYALLNVTFWLILLAALARYVGLRRARDVLLAAAMLWTTGALVSLTRALTDLPAAVLGVLVVLTGCRWPAAVGLLAGAGLIKETSILAAPAAPWRESPEGKTRGWLGIDWPRLVLSCVVVVLPVAAWLAYVHWRMPLTSAGSSGSAALGIFGIAGKLWRAAHDLPGVWTSPDRFTKSVLAFEFLCPLSLVVQAAYLAARPRLDARAWRFGIGFALLLCLLGSEVWKSQLAYARVLLPLTFAFNLLIHRHETGRRFALLYALGNGGMCWLALKLIA